ncbi:MAG: hypothetical protein ASARMPREDX12_005283 [Alectoria sarmentosa]|nr:MAG: hypothetical protein ASARMPREDX12_005283 [Alectoria sarmentosa]
MLPAILLIQILLLTPAANPSSLPLLPVSNLTPPAAFPTTDPAARMNNVLCRRDPDLYPLSDYATCIPSLFRLYATPQIRTPTLWVPGDFKQWGPETDRGGCYILVDGGGERDVFPIETLLGPAIWALGKCFVGVVEGRNRLAKTRIGPRKDWWLSIVLEATGVVVGGNGSVS